MNKITPLSFSPLPDAGTDIITAIKAVRSGHAPLDLEESDSDQSDAMQMEMEIDTGKVEEQEKNLDHFVEELTKCTKNYTDEMSPLSLSDEFMALPPEDLDRVMDSAFDRDSTKENLYLKLWNTLIQEESSGKRAEVCFNRLLLPIAMGLERSCSRVLLSALVSAVSKYPRVSLNSFLLPLWFMENFSLPIMELLTRLVIEGPVKEQVEVQNLFYQSILDISTSPKMDDARLSFFHKSIMSRLPVFALDECVISLIRILERDSGELKSSLKFVTLIIAIWQKYKLVCMPHKEVLKAAVSGGNTFMTKQAISLLDR